MAPWRAYYLRNSRLSLIILFVLIGLGGTVRAFEAGMGCPDWPKCYNQWLPPLNAKALPPNYKEHYLTLRQAKTKRLSRLLKQIGASKTAQRLDNHIETITETQKFHPLKAWLEYINRLVGVLLGLCLLIQVYTAHRYSHLTHNNTWRTRTLIALGIVIIQGLIGALIVQTHLFPFSITMHMLLTFALLFVLLKAIPNTPQTTPPLSKGLRYLWYAVGTLFLIQVLLGTQIRQHIEPLLNSIPRNQLIHTTDNLLLIHRLTALLLITLQALFCICLFKHDPHLPWRNPHSPLFQAITLLGLLGLASIIGGILYTYALPPSAQILHLWLPFLCFATWINLKNPKNSTP